MSMLKELKLVNGAPHIGLWSGAEKAELGASPFGCIQSEHDVFPPGHFEHYQELVQQVLHV